MDADLVRHYRARWEAVTEVEDAERRQASITSRWQQLNALFNMAVALGLDLGAQDEGELVVWERWARLKEGSG